MWRYIAERFAYDVGKRVVREAAKAQRASKPSNTVANATLEASAVWSENLRRLAHRKYELLTIDGYGLLSDDAWIDEWTNFTRHTLVPALSGFTQDVAMQALTESQGAFLLQLNANVLQIARNMSANGEASTKNAFIIQHF